MALRAGTASVSTFNGVLRKERYPYYVCTHHHATRIEARRCANAAKQVIDRPAANAELPRGWKVYDPNTQRDAP